MAKQANQIKCRSSIKCGQFGQAVTYNCCKSCWTEISPEERSEILRNWKEASERAASSLDFNIRNGTRGG